jgi:hypothetical protein
MHHDDPDRMSITDRLEELAALLAAGSGRHPYAPAA